MERSIITIISITFLSFGVLLPQEVAQANGADERYIDGLLVGLSSAPKSPLVGEKTGMLFYFQDAQTRKYLTTIPRAKVVIEVFIVEGRKGGDIVFETPTLDSSSGSFNADYIFERDGLYDIHVIFTTPDGQERNVGYLKQIRTGVIYSAKPLSEKSTIAVFAVTAILFFMVGYFIGKRRKNGSMPS